MFTDNLIPLDELTRISVLHSINILETPMEKYFENKIRILKGILKVPIAAISFVDFDRVWIKASSGLDFTEIERNEFFCSYTISSQGLLVVEDAKNDPNFNQLECVKNPPNIRFYVGVPIGMGDGMNLGAVSIMDGGAREVTSEDISFLMDMGEMISLELQSRMVKVA